MFLKDIIKLEEDLKQNVVISKPENKNIKYSQYECLTISNILI